jgi:hypothetical protein
LGQATGVPALEIPLLLAIIQAMRISDSRRKIITKLSINFSSIIFGLLVIGPFVSGKAVNSQIFIVGILLLIVFSLISVYSEPVNLKEDVN